MKAPVALLLLFGACAHAAESAYQGGVSPVSGSASYLCQGVATVTMAGRETSTYYITQPITVLPEQANDLAEAWGVHLETLHQYFIRPSPLIRERESAVPLQRRADDRRAQVVVARNCVELKTAPSGWAAYRHSMIYENKPSGAALVDDAFTYAAPPLTDQRRMYFCQSWSRERKTLLASTAGTTLHEVNWTFSRR